jgi:hypothetical protein
LILSLLLNDRHATLGDIEEHVKNKNEMVVGRGVDVSVVRTQVGHR